VVSVPVRFFLIGQYWMQLSQNLAVYTLLDGALSGVLYCKHLRCVCNVIRFVNSIGY